MKKIIIIQKKKSKEDGKRQTMQQKSYNGKRPFIVETINSPSADEEKKPASVSTLNKSAKSRKHVKIVSKKS